MGEVKGRAYKLVQIRGAGRAATADTLPLVLALLALGCEPLPEAPLVETIEPLPDGSPKIGHCWTFRPKSRCGKWETDTLRKWWHDEAWQAAHPEHPLTLMRHVEKLRPQVLAQLAKSVPLGIVRRGDRHVAIPIDATPEEEARLLAKLK